MINTVNTTVSAMAASNWLAMPNSGKSVLMPPSGSVTPMIRMAPQASTTSSEQVQAPTRQDGSRNLRAPGMLPIESDSMNRATLVPASTVVRMNSASNMIAKWYQNAFSPTPPSDLAEHLGHPERQGRRAAGAGDDRHLTDIGRGLG